MIRFDLVTLLIRVCQEYRDPARLSETRLIHTIYLIDWRSTVSRGRPLTNLTWKSDTLGPWTPEIMQIVQSHPDIFTISESQSMFGRARATVGLRKRLRRVRFEREAEEIIDFVISATRELDWGIFLDVVNLTYPVEIQTDIAGSRDILNLEALAEQRNTALTIDG